jgi:hypothetical protein
MYVARDCASPREYLGLRSSCGVGEWGVAEVGRPDALRMQVHGLFRSMLRNVEMQDVPRTIV